MVEPAKGEAFPGRRWTGGLPGPGTAWRRWGGKHLCSGAPRVEATGPRRWTGDGEGRRSGMPAGKPSVFVPGGGGGRAAHSCKETVPSFLPQRSPMGDT